jgi:Trypsin-like peptidase domain
MTVPLALEDLVAQAIGAVVMIETGASRGTGFFVASDLVVSNEHVVGREAVVTVRLHDGTTRQGRVERTAPEVDLALVRTATGGAPAVLLSLGRGDSTRVGQEVVAIGSALGLQSTVTRGILSAKRQSGAVALLQTDAAINPGNSGGPLLDRAGVVIGVTTLKAGGPAEGVGFAVAAEHVHALLSGQAPTRSALAQQTAVPPSQAGPPVGSPRPLPLPTTSDADAQRAATLAAFEREFGNLAGSAAQVDAQWESFARTCRPQPSRDGDRPWFALSLGPVAYASHDGNCPYWLSDLQANSRTFVGAVRAVEEAARRQGVLPGDVRGMRRRHRLDWTGFDR